MSKLPNLYYQNVRGLNLGINEVIDEINCNKYDRIAITETWFI